MVAALPTAFAALVPVPPSPIIDLSTTKSFDTGAMMAKLCPAPRQVDFFRDETFWFYDRNTGSLTEDTTKGVRAEAIDSEIDRFKGHCEFPVTAVKDDVGPAQTVSRPLVNCGEKVTLSESVTQSVGTSSTYTTSVSIGVGFDVKVIKDVLGLSGNASVTQSWSFGSDKTITRNVGITVPPRTKGSFERVPVIRTVISQPIFVVEFYSRVNRDGDNDLNGFEDTGTPRITSPAFQTRSAADALDADGFPSGTIRSKDQPVTPADCD
jgi:hypothetical protein